VRDAGAIREDGELLLGKIQPLAQPVDQGHQLVRFHANFSQHDLVCREL